MQVAYTTKNSAFRVVLTKAGYSIQQRAHTGKALRWVATIAKPTASLAKAKHTARYLAGC